MKLVRFGPIGRERPGVLLDDHTILDVRAMAFDIEDYNAHFFSTFGLQRLAALLRESAQKRVPAEGLRLGPPVARPSKIICMGKNYIDHAKEFDADIPTHPVLFSKAPSSIIGPFDPILLSSGATNCDIEVELALVIGKRMQRVSEADAMSFIAGYTVLNDVTDRDAQREGKQWFRGKSPDSFCPLGPALVTTDEVTDPHALCLYSKIGDRVLQNSHTSKMLFRISYLLSFISKTITLEPGDVISTGTPGGIGSAQTPPVLLNIGDGVEIGVEQVGVQISPVMRKQE